MNPERTARAGSGLMRRARRRRGMIRIWALLPWRPAMVPAGPSSTSMTISPPLIFRSGRSKSSSGDCSTCKARPVAGVTISVWSIGRILPRIRPTVAHASKASLATRPRSTTRRVGPSRRRPTRRPLHPGGLGREFRVFLSVHHPRFALQTIEVVTDGTSESKSVTATLVPAQILTGRVTYADTGKGVAHSPLRVMSSQGRISIVPNSRPTPWGGSA